MASSAMCAILVFMLAPCILTASSVEDVCAETSNADNVECVETKASSLLQMPTVIPPTVMPTEIPPTVAGTKAGSYLQVSSLKNHGALRIHMV